MKVNINDKGKLALINVSTIRNYELIEDPAQEEISKILGFLHLTGLICIAV